MRRPRVPSRGGWSLIELTVVISATSSILGVVLVLAMGMMRLNRTAQHYDEARRGEQRLETALRTDIHAAFGVETDAAAPGVITLSLPDSTSIVYRVLEDRIERRVEQDGKEEHREAFYLPRGLSPRWETDEANLAAAESDSRPRRISAVFERTPSADNNELPRYDWRVTAVVGLDHLRVARWEGQP